MSIANNPAKAAEITNLPLLTKSTTNGFHITKKPSQMRTDNIHNM